MPDSEQDIKLIRRAFELLNQDFAAGSPRSGGVASQSVWVDEPEILPLRAALEDGAFYAGPDALERFRDDSLEIWSELDIEVGEITGDGPRYLVEASFRGRGRGSGAEIRTPIWLVMTVRGGRLARGTSHFDRDSALAELGEPG